MQNQATDKVTAWDLPYVEDSSQGLDPNTTNAFNHRSDWKYEPPEEDIEIIHDELTDGME